MATSPSSTDLTDAARQDARAAGLRYVTDTQPGIARRRAGKGFGYRDAQGKAVRDAVTLDRIRMLAIPPAYTEVWICALPNGHIQATGRDARHRKQYRYHPDWATARGEGKFDRVIAFGEALPKLRRRLARDLALPGYPRDKVLAIVVAVMASTLIRVGNAGYAKENKSFGLTTLRNRHVEFTRSGRARFRFRGKGGLDHDVVLDDARLAKLLRGIEQLPGQHLFQYETDDGSACPVDSSDVNDYLRVAMGEDFTAKDFRTWGGTLASFQLLSTLPLPEAARGDTPSERALVSAQNEVIKQVADMLGNTPTVCRKAYIDPAVFTGWRDGTVQAASARARGARQWEAAALRYLKAVRRKARKATK